MPAGDVTPGVMPQDARHGIVATLLPVTLALLFSSCVLYIRAFQIGGPGLDQRGSALLVYHLCRVGLVFFTIVFCYCAGYRTLGMLRLNVRGLFDSARKTFILCFFFGASLYGILFTVLGLFGLVNLATALVFTLPVILFSRRPLAELARGSPRAGEQDPLRDAYTGRIFMWLVTALAGYAVLAVVVTRVLHIAVFDPNIWEHYAHYYRAVLASGSTQPNEVWHHFYASKGAGLILLVNVLSDFLGAQIVSACFVLAAGMVILDLLQHQCKSTGWAMFGVMIYLAFLYGGAADGAAFKHHCALLGYASFALWGVVSLQDAPPLPFRAVVVAMLVSFFYVGFYLPVSAAMFASAFMLVALTNAIFRTTTHVRALLVLASGLCAGAGLAMVVNWAITGLAEVTPMRLFWAIADQAEVERVFGTGGIRFFLNMNNDLRNEYDWSLRRTWTVLRYPLSAALLFWGLLALLVALIQTHTRAVAASSMRFLAYVAAFVLPLSVFAQGVQTNAVDRMALYSIVLTTLASVVILNKLVEAYVGRTIWRAPIPGTGGVEIKPWVVASMIIMLLGITTAMVHAWKGLGKEQRSVIYRFATGEVSLKGSFQLAEANEGKRAIGIGIEAMSEFRKNAADGRILRLSYEGGFAYALPGEGIVSEPTYSLVRDPKALMTAGPEEVAKYLRDRGIRYFSLDLQHRLFSTIAFTPLFDVHQMPRYFSVAYQEGEFVMLTWRERADDPPLSEYLLTIMEIKRAGVLRYPFTEQFAARLLGTTNDLVTDRVAFEKVRKEFGQNLAREFTVEMLPAISLATSRILLHDVLRVAREAVEGADADGLLGAEKTTLLRQALDAGRDRSRARVEDEVGSREIRTQLLRLARSAIHKKYELEMGGGFAGLFAECDERVPFANAYPASAACFGSGGR